MIRNILELLPNDRRQKLLNAWKTLKFKYADYDWTFYTAVPQAAAGPPSPAPSPAPPAAAAPAPAPAAVVLLAPSNGSMRRTLARNAGPSSRRRCPGASTSPTWTRT